MSWRVYGDSRLCQQIDDVVNLNGICGPNSISNWGFGSDHTPPAHKVIIVAWLVRLIDRQRHPGLPHELLPNVALRYRQIAIAGGGIEVGRRRGEHVRHVTPVNLFLGHDDVFVESLGGSRK